MRIFNGHWALITQIFICATLSTGCSPAEAQHPEKVPRLAFLGASSYEAAVIDPFRQGLHEFGYTEGKNIVVEYRWAEGKYDQLTDLAAELVRLNVDIMITQSDAATRAAKRLTTSIPIIFVGIGDAVATGLVDSLAKPGGNITGISNLSPELSGKRLELLKEAFPKVSRVAVIWNPSNRRYTDKRRTTNSSCDGSRD